MGPCRDLPAVPLEDETLPRSDLPVREYTTSSGATRYRATVDAGVHPDTGRRRQVTRVFATRREARSWVAATRTDVARGAYLARSTDTLDALCQRWLDGRRDVREITVQGYRYALVPARRRLGERRVQDLTVADLDGLAEWMRREGGRGGRPLSPRSVAATLGAVSQVLDLAMREELVARNVARMVKRPRQVRRDAARWDAAQAAAFRAHVLPDRLAAAWLLSLAGLRRSEVLGLRWEDVDLDAGTVRVERGRVSVTATTDAVDEPKSEQSRRVIPVGLIPGVVPALRTLRTRQSAERLARGTGYRSSGYVVVDERGRAPRPEWYSDRFSALCREADVPVIHLHATRHTAADTLLAAGVPAVDVAAWLGHTTEVLHDRYGRSTPGGIRAVGEALARAYGG